MDQYTDSERLPVASSNSRIKLRQTRQPAHCSPCTHKYTYTFVRCKRKSMLTDNVNKILPTQKEPSVH